MSPKSITTIYLEPAQKRTLVQLAKRRKSTIASQVRAAIDRYIHQDPDEESWNEEEITHLASEASRSIDRMARKLDEAHKVVEATIHSIKSR